MIDETQFTERFKKLCDACDEEREELKKAVEEYGIDWLIAHYHCAIMNWNFCIDERDQLQAELDAIKKELEIT